MRVVTAILLGIWLTFAASAERINQEGRILGDLPFATNSILFNTPAADSIVSAMQVFPVNNPWNEDISRRPVLVNSSAMIAQISSDLASSRRTLRAFMEMNFVLVPDGQPSVPISFVDYPDESDPSPYPIPGNMPIETWPSGTGSQTLFQWQQDPFNTGGDRHAIIVQPGTGLIREMWQAKLAGTNWQASNGAKFDIKSNALRPLGWTSGDAAGLPMFPALVRFDECERGMVEHAMRLVVARSRREYIYPATHFASSTSSSQTNVPAMGQRLRLKASFSIPANWTRQEKSVLLAFKKYGAIVADNGGFFSVSVTPDDRWPADAFSHLSSINVTNFEVILTTGPNEGPRSPGGPTANTGLDQTVALGSPVPLSGRVTCLGAPPSVQWQLYSGPGGVVFGDSTQSATTVSFSAPGIYTLMLRADDGVHTPAFDATVITVMPSIALSVFHSGPSINLSWTGQFPFYVVETSDTLTGSNWTSALTTAVQTAVFPISKKTAFYRVRGQ